MSGALQRALLAARTARHLRARQIVGRVRVVLRGHARPRDVPARWHDERAARVVAALDALGPVAPADEVRHAAAAWRGGTLAMLGRTGPAPVTWREPSPSPLWAYHVHYHDALADAAWAARDAGDADGARAVHAAIATWEDAWRLGGAPAWDPYPITVRALNWLRILAWTPLEGAGRDRLRTSLAAQLDVLARSLEWHLDGNHLLRDAWALAIAPWCFAEPWAERAGRDGTALFWRCFLEQVGADGVHEERSPMYHARVLRDALEVLAVHRALGLSVPDEGVRRVAAMARALRWLRHPDGALRLVNDAASDHGVDLDAALVAAGGLADADDTAPDGTWWAADARFLAHVDRARGDALLVDLSAPAPAHQPGHAHAAALSFECDVESVPLVVDGGMSGYDGDSWRRWLRSTPAHSTVAFDGRDQSELWATFRVARRAVVEVLDVRHADGACEATARCRPYHRPGAVHERRIRRERRAVVIDDRVDGATGATVEGFVHLDPAWDATRADDGTVVLTRGDRRAVVRVEGATVTLHRGERAPDRGWRAVRFNEVVPAWSLRLVPPAGRAASWRTTITPA